MRKKLKKRKLSIISRLKVFPYGGPSQAQRFGLLNKKTTELECDGCVLYRFCISILNQSNNGVGNNGRVLPFPCTAIERQGPVKFPEISEVGVHYNQMKKGDEEAY